MSARLEIGRSRTIVVSPRPLFVSCGIEVRAGERYLLRAEGRWQDGRMRPCGPEGWTVPGLGWARRWNRLPGANWFVLCACLGTALQTSRAVAPQCDWTIEADQARLAGSAPVLLQAFANDWPGRYANNREVPADRGGPMRLTVERVA